MLFLNLDIKFFEKKKNTIDIFSKNKINTVGDLLFFLPLEYKKYYMYNTFEEIEEEKYVILNLQIEYKKKLKDGVIIFSCIDEKNKIVKLMFFHMLYVNKFTIKQKIHIMGKYNSKYKSFVNPIIKEGKNQIQTIIQTVYKCNVISNWIKKNRYIFKFLNNSERFGKNLYKIVSILHFPTTVEQLETAVEEYKEYKMSLLYLQHTKNIKNEHFVVDEKLYIEKIHQLTLFQQLFTHQQNTIKEIVTYTYKNKNLRCVLQGEVGSGKTLVTFFIVLYFLFNNMKIVFISPTKVLSNQTYNNFKKYFESINFFINISIVDESKQFYENDTQLIFSTNSFFYIKHHQNYNNKFDFIIVDEEQKFGVEQRNIMSSYINNIMQITATPIPRTISILQLNILKLFILNTDDRCITTHIIDDWKSKVKSILDENKKILIIVPYLTKQHIFSMSSVVEFLENSSFTYTLLSSKLTLEQQQKNLNCFSNNEVQICISTTVVEVGINVENLYEMIILGCENYGLSTLHQLRGRMNRNPLKIRPANCYLVVENKNEKVLNRINLFTKCTSGVQLSWIDYLIRGGGNTLGLQQKGKKYKLNLDNFHFKIFNLLKSEVEYTSEEIECIFKQVELEFENLGV